MTFIDRLLNQRATYWAPPASGNAWGYKGSFAAPKTLFVRWEQKVERFINKAGDDTESLAIVYLPQAVAVGGYLYLGKSSTTDPRSVENAFLIQQCEDITDLKADTNLRKAYL